MIFSSHINRSFCTIMQSSLTKSPSSVTRSDNVGELVILHTSQNGSLDMSATLGLVEMRNILKVYQAHYRIDSSRRQPLLTLPGYQMTFAAELLMGPVITSVKISILWFYYKAFVTGQDVLKKRLIRGTVVACLMWFIGVTFFIIFSCHHIYVYWDMFGQAPYCMKLRPLSARLRDIKLIPRCSHSRNSYTYLMAPADAKKQQVKSFSCIPSRHFVSSTCSDPNLI